MAEQLDMFAENPEPPSPEKTDQSGSRILYFDLETKKGSSDVGGWGNIHLMGLAVGVVWDSREEKYFSYLEKDADQLVDKLKSADLVVGFNVIGFDYTVLQPYAKHRNIDLQDIPTFDMLTDVHKKLKHRLALNNLAEYTLGAKKSADGLVSLQWYQEYLAGDAKKLKMIADYCEQDVAITRDLFLYGQKHGLVKYSSKTKGPAELKVDWSFDQVIPK